MSRNLNRNRDGHVQRRSQSSHQPYHAVTETYSKEVTTRPLGPVEDFPKDIVNILRETNQSPPLIRSRENTWTTENFPIVRVPSAQFTDILTELYDYHEVEKYTRRSVTPDIGTLRRQSEFKELPMERGGERAPPSYKIIPPTPEKNTPRNPQGIPLKTEKTTKKPLPMYEEYVQEIQNRSRIDENQNPRSQGLPPIPRPRSRTPEPLKGPVEVLNNNLRHIDSSSSESNTTSEEDQKRYVYSHDVFVDPTTGRPFTPGRTDSDEKNCGKLKINVYFKPPHPPVLPVYTLDEIEIEKQEEILVPKLRPLSSGISGHGDGSEAEHSEEMTTRRIPTRTTLLRKENEVVTIPLGRSQSVGQSSRTSGTIRSTTSSKTPSERTIPIHVDELFPRIPRHPDLQKLREQREREREQQETRSVDKGDYNRQRHPSLKERHPDRSTSFISQTPSHKSASEIVQSVSSSRAADVIERRPQLSHKTQRPSPEELHYGGSGKNQVNRDVEVLPYTRGISKTPSVPDSKSERSSSFKSSTTLPVYTQVERDERHVHSTRTTPIHPNSESRDERHPSRHGKETPNQEIYIPRNGEKEERPRHHSTTRTPSIQQVPLGHQGDRDERPRHHSATKTPSIQQVPLGHQGDREERTPSSHPSHTHTRQNSIQELPYTRGISKTPSVQDHYKTERSPSKGSSIQIPVQHEETRTHGPQKPQRSPSSKSRATSRPNNQPYEEVIQIKERYERDETIRRFYPTTTSV